MKKAELTKGTILIEKTPSKHTDKLHKMEIKSKHMAYSFSKKRNYTYYICMTLPNTYYPAANNKPGEYFILDGLMGDYTLSKLKKEYKILSN